MTREKFIDLRYNKMNFVSLICGIIVLVGLILFFTLPIVAVGESSLIVEIDFSDFMDQYDEMLTQGILLFLGLIFLVLAVGGVGYMVSISLNKKLVELSIFNPKANEKQIESSKKMAENYKTYAIICSIIIIVFIILGLVLVSVGKDGITEHLGINSSYVNLGTGSILFLVFGIVGMAINAGCGGYLLYLSNNIKEVEDNLEDNLENEKSSESDSSELNYIDELKALKELLDTNVITQEEFDKKKDELLNK